ncbi:hypothetical protein D1AOALGA4SA_3553 [Olavius algarvensis Delta 1 endosymbiont]|nr:hypothetical protein D1AOALGA4SA_3553 [Olavius algarvensis Delta 1 endosymbiont]
MKNIALRHWRVSRGLTISIAMMVFVIAASLSFGHGGKHADKFTQLQALQKATKLYDQLISKGKLDQSWENGLENVKITTRKREGKDEIVVSFQRKEGEPKAVYIFFSPKGKYAGSNFTGE